MLNQRTSLPEVLAARAAAVDQVAYRFLRNGWSDCATWTYRDLERIATHIAVELQPYEPYGKRIMLSLETGLLYIAALFAILKVGAIAVPCYPPTSKRAKARFAAILADCAPQLIIADNHTRFAEARIETINGVHSVPHCLVIEESSYHSEVGSSLPLGPSLNVGLAAQMPALLQYTSGSTGTPKGVVISHGNLIANCEAMEHSLVPTPHQRLACSWLPPYHDMGLMGGIFAALYSGFPLVMLSPMHFAQNPYRWLKAISEHRATLSSAPNFALDLCVDAVSDAEVAELDLSSLRQLYCGAEPVQQSSLQRFSERFAVSGFSPTAFVPCYGMAEATLFVAGKSGSVSPRIEVIDRVSLTNGVARMATTESLATVAAVSCGSVAANHELAIVDPHTCCRIPTGTIGEIWLRGPSIASSYWQRPQESTAAFTARIAGEEFRGEFLRTGDLGFLLEQELFVTGRLNDVIVIAGRHLYPQDIERSVMRGHDLIRANAAAFLCSAHCPEQLVVVAELSRRFLFSRQGLDEVRRHVRAAVLEEHGIALNVIHLAPAGSIPLTTSGKVRRSACRNAYLQGTLPAIQAVGISRESRIARSVHTEPVEAQEGH